MRRTHLLFCLLLVTSAAGPAASQETATSPRQRLLMDYGWTFATGEFVGAEVPGFDDSAWRDIDLPHDWSIEGPYDSAAATTGRGGYLPTGVGWYRRSFTLPPGSSDRRFLIEFDGVYENSDVWVNGRHLGHRPYGYISFAYDLTSHLVEGKNVVAVRVDNSHQPNTRWYSGSGIYRHVWLTVTDPLHIGHRGTFVTTPDADSEAARIEARIELVNDGYVSRSGTIRSEIRDASGAEVARTESPFALVSGEQTEFAQEFRLAGPSLWSPESPALYNLRTTLQDADGLVVDETNTPIGIRHIA